MKSSNLKIVAAALSCLVISSALIGCSTKTQNNTDTPPSTNQNQSQSETQQTQNQASTDHAETTDSQSSNNITLDIYNEKINYYMATVESLQAEISRIKEENYIEESEYKALDSVCTSIRVMLISSINTAKERQ